MYWQLSFDPCLFLAFFFSRVLIVFFLLQICVHCPGSVRNLSEVAFFCEQTPELKLHARCCLNQKGAILG